MHVGAELSFRIPTNYASVCTDNLIDLFSRLYFTDLYFPNFLLLPNQYTTTIYAKKY
jgi:hypothetical protein